MGTWMTRLATSWLVYKLTHSSLMLGTIGEKNRMDGTVISDAVNLASRIESLTKEYHVGLLISQYTYEQLADGHTHRELPQDQ